MTHKDVFVRAYQPCKPAPELNSHLLCMLPHQSFPRYRDVTPLVRMVRTIDVTCQSIRRRPNSSTYLVFKFTSSSSALSADCSSERLRRDVRPKLHRDVICGRIETSVRLLRGGSEPTGQLRMVEDVYR